MGRCQLERDSLSFGSVAAVVELSQGGEGSAPNLLHATESTTAVPSRDIWPSADGLMTGGRKVCGDGALGLHSFGPRIRSSVWSRGGVGNAQEYGLQFGVVGMSPKPKKIVSKLRCGGWGSGWFSLLTPVTPAPMTMAATLNDQNGDMAAM